MSGARQFSLKWHNSASRFLSANSSLPMQVHKRLANTVSAQPRSKMSLFRPSLGNAASMSAAPAQPCGGLDRLPFANTWRDKLIIRRIGNSDVKRETWLLFNSIF